MREWTRMGLGLAAGLCLVASYGAVKFAASAEHPMSQRCFMLAYAVFQSTLAGLFIVAVR